MSNGFVHSVKVPRIYKVTANIVRRVCEEGASLKTLIYEKKHPNVSGIYSLSTNTLRALPQLDQLISKTEILIEQPRLDPWLTRVLITELLWGKKCLGSDSKPVLTLLSYEYKLREEARNLNCINISIADEKTVRKPRYVRINTLLLSLDEAISSLQEEGWHLLQRSTTYSSYLHTLSQLSKPNFIRDFHIPEILVFPSSTSFYEHPGYQSGKFILQDKASCLPVHLLNPLSGSVILDICAAPGMKATYLAAKLQNNGKIYAVEIDVKRFGILCSFIEKTQSSCIEAINQDALTLDPQRYSQVEYILVDPSCSGSGIIDRPKQNDMDGKPEPKRLKNLQSFQVYLLRYALLNFPNAKKIIYSTCSLHPEENEQVIDEVLANIGNAYHLIPARHTFNDKWINFSSKEYNCKDKCLYSRPNVDFCNGFFVAVFERNFNVALPTYKGKGGNVNLIDVNLDMDNKDDEKISLKRKKRGKRKNKQETSSMNEETRISEDAERDKSKKRRLEHENVTQINIDQETTRNRDYVKTEQKNEHEQKDEIKIKLKRKEENEQLSNDETDRKINENGSERKKKKRKHKEKIVDDIE